MQAFLDLKHFGVDESPKDDTEIIQVMLYFSKPESEEFKKLCKAGIKEEFGIEAIKKGNVSDFLLILLRKKYGKIKVKESYDGHSSGIIDEVVPPV